MEPGSPAPASKSKVAPVTNRVLSMRRRDFIGCFTALLACSARAQVPTKPALIAFLTGGSTPDTEKYRHSFERGLQEFGYRGGRDYLLEVRAAEGVVSRLPSLAQELVSLRPNLIVASNGTVAVHVKKATSDIPIVSPLLSDPIGQGLIASYARPGGNVTGILGPASAGQVGKQLSLARELVPSATRIGLLTASQYPSHEPQQRDAKAAAAALAVNLVSADIRSPDDIDGAIRTLAREGVGVVLVFSSALLFTERRRIAAAALSARLPTVYSLREHVDDGGLMSYGTSQHGSHQQAARFVDKILKGARPADLPVELPTKFELVINLKVAASLGLHVPLTLLTQADEVIE